MKKHILILLQILVSFLLIQSCKNKTIEFAEKFEDVSLEFNSFFDKTDFTNINFNQTLTICSLPLSQKDVSYFLDPISQPEKLPLAIIVSEELKTPIFVSLLFANMLDTSCEKTKCSFGTNQISYNIEKEEKNIQEGYKKEILKINTDRGNITITKYINPLTTEIVANISVELENKVENIKFASKITQAGETVETYEVENIVFQNGTKCRSKTKIYGGQREINISLVSPEGKQNFYGYIKKVKGCQQKPVMNLSSRFGLIDIGSECDFIFPTSNIEFFSLLIKNRAENFDDFSISLLEKLSQKFEILTEELNLIKFAKLVNDLSQSFSIIKMMYDQNFQESISLKIQEAEKLLGGIKIAIPNRLKLKFSEDFSIEITKPVNEPSLLFLELYIQILKVIFLYIRSLDLNLPENLKNQIINEIQQKISLKMSDKMEILAKSLEGSKSFLMTSDDYRREIAFLGIKRLVEIFLEFLSKIQNYSFGVFAKDASGIYIQTQKGKFYFSPIPKYPDVITQILQGGVNYNENWQIQLFMRFLEDFIRKFYISGEGESETLEFIIYILNKINTNYHSIGYVDFPKIFFSNLREIFPAWTKDGKLAIEWDCAFPERLTCNAEVFDREHFSSQLIFSEPITENITVWDYKFPQDSIRTRFPYIIYKEPSFFGAIRINLIELGDNNLISKVCGVYIDPLLRSNYLPQGKEGICILNLWIAYLTREN